MTDATLHTPLDPRRNRRVVVICVGIVAAMGGLAYASVPLYQLFCQVTGFGGTPRLAEDAPRGLIDRQMTVRFDASVAPTLNWKVVAARPVTDQVGAVETINYQATNLSDVPVTGTAVFNVTPEIAGGYFNKMECFCFTEQTLQPGETVDMPVTFFVDPDIDGNGDLDTVREITLSYTFYPTDSKGR
jgi:cytochrome c oxidase assembly protein subunit 11